MFWYNLALLFMTLRLDIHAGFTIKASPLLAASPRLVIKPKASNLCSSTSPEANGEILPRLLIPIILAS